MNEECHICRHFGRYEHDDDRGHSEARRLCHRPRMVKETIEWRRPTDWCRYFLHRMSEVSNG